MAHHQFELASGRRLGVTILGEPTATRFVFLCLPTSCGAPFDPDPAVTARAGVRLVEIDRPGYNASDPLPDGVDPTVEQFADDIAEYFRAVQNTATDISGPQFGKAAAAGWSFGGAVATAFAARHADLVDSLAVVASPRPGQMHEGQPYSMMTELRKRGVERSRASLQESLDELGRPTLVNLGVDDRDPALEPLGVRGRVERMLEAGWAQRSSGIASDRLAVRDGDLLQLASAVDQDALLVYGENDEFATREDADWYARKIKGATLSMTAGAGHLVLVSEWKRVLDFALDRRDA